MAPRPLTNSTLSTDPRSVLSQNRRSVLRGKEPRISKEDPNGILTGTGGTVPAISAPPETLPTTAQAPAAKPRAQGATSSAPAKQDESLDLLAQMRADQAKEKQAQEAELAKTRQQALADASARSGFGGFGLSGGSAALQSDIGRQQSRTAELARADLGRKQRDEQFQAIQRQVALSDLESAQDEDIDHDGKIAGKPVGGKVGDGDPENNPEEPVDKEKRDISALQARDGGTGAPNDPFGGIGGYGDQSQQVLDQLHAAGITFSYEKTEGGIANGEQYVIAIGSDGKTYKFKVPGTGLLHHESIDQVKKWFGPYETTK